ncbi:hypothetical protein DFP73DRAFT_562146 [Morchella snyderi]|nr:hypothetical protein DFP73DRAFT_562146 [Morchella snyderi]
MSVFLPLFFLLALSLLVDSSTPYFLGIKMRVFFCWGIVPVSHRGKWNIWGGVEPLRHESSGATEKQRRTGRRRGGGDVRWGCCGCSLGWLPYTVWCSLLALEATRVGYTGSLSLSLWLFL